MIRPASLAACTWLLLLSACDKKEAPSGSPLPSPSASASASVAVVAVPSAEASSAKVAPVVEDNVPVGAMGLDERLRAEAKTRPSGTITAESGFAAMKEAGALLDTPKQHLGSVWKANYCTAAINAAEDFVVDFCEFADSKVAKESLDMAKKGFSSIPGREVHQNGATLLTLRVGKPTPENKALAKKLVDAFAKLKAPPKTPAPSSSTR
jgi:hypothetical protein